jgi:SulP family sulfate permease
MVLAVFLFFKKMTEISNVSAVLQDDEAGNGDDDLSLYDIPGNTQVFELSGPLFFGAAYKFKDSIVSMKKKPEYLIVRMRHVPVIDSTGIYTLRDVLKMCRTKNITMVISEAQPAVLQELRKTRLLFSIGKRYVTTDFDTALARVTQNMSTEKEFNEITGN